MVKTMTKHTIAHTAPAPGPVPEPTPGGLSDEEAARRLQETGPNAVAEQRPHPFRLLLGELWGPIPWMLEASVIIEFVLGKTADALITLALLLVNAVLSFVQATRAQNALALLRQQLAVQARVQRNGTWRQIPAQELVPGDIVHIRMGDIAPADVRVAAGLLAVDQSALTGESAAVDVGVSATVYAGSIVRRGEATGEVTATGSRTFYGKTAQLVGTAKTASHLESVVQGVTAYLAAVSVAMLLLVVIYGTLVHKLPLGDLLPFALILLVASVPVALPATFTLAAALGAGELAKRNVLVARLSAVEEAAGMDVLCSDKTGTITQNSLSLATIQPFAPYTAADTLRLAALCSEGATQDPIDLAILRAAQAQGAAVDLSTRLSFTPFDSATKYTAAVVQTETGQMGIVKGFPQSVSALAGRSVEEDVQALAAHGYRVLAVAAGPDHQMQLVGLVALEDPPRPDSKDLLVRLQALGVRIIMVTGDGLATARAVAAQVGLTGKACPAETLKELTAEPDPDCQLYAGVFPEDKYHLVRALQTARHVVGMTGDGVNDAPALKQAEVGIAVSTATDVAKAAASLILTTPGLGNIVAAVETGRRIFQRMLTYTLNKVIKTFQVGFFLSLGLLLTGQLIVRPHLILLLVFANDFVSMALATDTVSYSAKPDRWHLRSLVVSALVIAAGWMAFSFAALYWANSVLRLPLAELQTFIFVLLVFTGQANIYLVRERSRFWRSRPSKWLLVSSVVDVAIISAMAAAGIWMAPLAPWLLVALAVGSLLYGFVLDFLKVYVFRRQGVLAV